MRRTLTTMQRCRGRSTFSAIDVPTCADLHPKKSGGPSLCRPGSGSTRHFRTLPICVVRHVTGNVGRPRSKHRRGITLFEVMLALAIFLGAFAAIAQVIDLGRQASVAGQLENEAVLRAQTKLAEVIAGVEPMSGLQGQAFEDDPNWTWGLEIGDGPHVDLLGLTITVEHTRPSGTVDAQFVLRRLVRDPQLFIDAAASASLSEES